MVTTFNKDPIPIHVDPHVNLINVDQDLDILIKNCNNIMDVCLNTCFEFNDKYHTTISDIKLDDVRYVNNQYITFLLYSHTIEDEPNQHHITTDILIDRYNNDYRITSIYIK